MSKLASATTFALTLALSFSLGAPRAQAAPRKVTIKAPPLPPSTEELLVASPQHADWVPSEKLGMPAGAEVALIGADPVSTGPTMYLKARAGWHLPMHWHIHTSYLTLVTGRVTLTIDGKKHALVPGSFVVVPSRAKHELTCAPGAECLLVDRRSGPVDYFTGSARPGRPHSIRVPMKSIAVALALLLLSAGVAGAREDRYVTLADGGKVRCGTRRPAGRSPAPTTPASPRVRSSPIALRPAPRLSTAGSSRAARRRRGLRRHDVSPVAFLRRWRAAEAGHHHLAHPLLPRLRRLPERRRDRAAPARSRRGRERHRHRLSRPRVRVGLRAGQAGPPPRERQRARGRGPPAHRRQASLRRGRARRRRRRAHRARALSTRLGEREVTVELRHRCADARRGALGRDRGLRQIDTDAPPGRTTCSGSPDCRQARWFTIACGSGPARPRSRSRRASGRPRSARPRPRARSTMAWSMPATPRFTPRPRAVSRCASRSTATSAPATTSTRARSAAAEEDPDLAILTGDLVDRGSDEGDWESFFDIARPLLRQLAIFPAPGNHEYAPLGHGIAKFLSFFRWPLRPGEDDAAFYSFDRVGRSLRRARLAPVSLAAPARLVRPRPREARRSGARAIFVYAHEALLSTGLHGDNATCIHDYAPLMERTTSRCSSPATITTTSAAGSARSTMSSPAAAAPSSAAPAAACPASAPARPTSSPSPTSTTT